MAARWPLAAPQKAAIGCAALAGLLCLTLAAPLVNLAQRGRRVEAAVRASFPGFCSEWRDKVIASPNPLGGFTMWDISCESGYFPGRVMAMTVNVATCQVRPPLKFPFGWRQVYQSFIGSGRPMAVRP